MAQRTAPESNPDDGDSPDYVARLLKGSGSVFSGSMVGKIVGFTLNLVLARGLGSVLFGMYSLGLTVLRVAQSLATLGLQNGIVRFGAPSHESGETAEVKGTFIVGGGLGFAAGTAIGGLLFAAAPWLAVEVFNTPEMASVLQIFACGLPFYVFTYLLSRMARALSKMQVDVLLDAILQPALFLLLAGGIFAAGGSLTITLYAFLASTVLAAGMGVFVVYRQFPPLLSSLRPIVKVRPLLRFSLPIVGVTLASIGLTYTDRIMLGILSTSESVGLYQIAARVSEQLRFVLFAITAAFSPVISDLYHNDKVGKLTDLYASTVRWILLATLPAAILLIAYAPQIMGIWGPDFRDGAPLLRILAVAHIMTTSVGSVGQILQMSDHQDFVFAVNTAMAVLNVALNWLLIQLYGPAGAAIATGLTQVLGNVVQSIALHRFTGIHPFRLNLWKPVAAAGIGTLFAWGLYMALTPPLTWVLGVPGTLLVYTGGVYLLGLTPRDRSILQALWVHARTRLS